ncbi:PAS domain S-box protein [Candidatus Sulfurimonas marisnigri]|uniref:histidine kinase n=1 Tax=Candidatus Sulfurimonas marisnigri TaxID=2740405 RepID=A0A7S7LYK4_9BACT|nr:PAS domain S-box protein [Candidatus Sulfurimonas marisnigri]QOY53858.1 PAS domain S-box protein [Candidatus Sulfurimonas marisnigri]
MNVLIVDDNKDNLVLLSSMLESLGLSVQEASNGIDALNLAQATPPDIIISDILMPKMDGFTLCRVMKCIDNLQDVPFVFYTATYLEKEDEELGLALGACCYIHKPLEPVLFIQRIKEIIDKYYEGAINRSNKQIQPQTRIDVLYQERISQKLDKKISDVVNLREKEVLILSTVRDGIFVLDIDGKHTIVNQAAADMLGYTIDEMIGKNSHEMWHHTHPDGTTFHESDCPIYKTMKKQSSALQVETLFWRKDGSSFTVDCSSNPLVENGELNGVVVVFRDISERKRAETALQESEARFRKLFEYTDAIAVQGYDKNHRVIYWNRASENLFGYSCDYAMGKQIDELIIPDEICDKVNSDIAVWIKGGQSIPSSERVLKKEDGSDVTVFSNCVLLENQYNEPEMYCIDIDLTELKEAQEELKKQEDIVIAQSRQAAMGEMVAMIAHQWRQPLTVVSMAVNNLKIDMELGNKVTNEMIDEMSDRVFDQVNHLSKTIDDFSDFLKPDKKKESVNVCDVMERAMRMTGNSLKNNNIDVDITMKSKKNVNIYPSELLQAFLNIINNAKDAVKHSESNNPRIAIEINEVDGFVVTTICDNGGGISNDTMQLLGQPYVSTKNKNGTGLGIYMSKTIIEKHLKGTLSWKNVGDGACFTVALRL